MSEWDDYGCALDDHPHHCVFESGVEADIAKCPYAATLHRAGRDQTYCNYWLPILFFASGYGVAV